MEFFHGRAGRSSEFSATPQKSGCGKLEAPVVLPDDLGVYHGLTGNCLLTLDVPGERGLGGSRWGEAAI
jgi:hypothetical protein